MPIPFLVPNAHRYEQFCVVARTAEVLGHRWTPLLLRDLLLGPQRFSDLRRKQNGLTASVLTQRLEQLEGHGLVRRRRLPPPAASQVYELTPLGQCVRPVLIEMARFGVLLLDRPARIDDAIDPAWFALVVDAFGRREPLDRGRWELRLRGAESDRDAPTVVRVEAGTDGTRRVPPETPDWEPDVVLSSPVAHAINLLAGILAPDALRDRPDVELGGDPAALDRFPDLFETPSRPTEPDSEWSPEPAGLDD